MLIAKEAIRSDCKIAHRDSSSGIFPHMSSQQQLGIYGSAHLKATVVSASSGIFNYLSNDDQTGGRQLVKFDRRK